MKKLFCWASECIFNFNYLKKSIMSLSHMVIEGGVGDLHLSKILCLATCVAAATVLVFLASRSWKFCGTPKMAIWRDGSKWTPKTSDNILKIVVQNFTSVGQDQNMSIIGRWQGISVSFVIYDGINHCELRLAVMKSVKYSKLNKALSGTGGWSISPINDLVPPLIRKTFTQFDLSFIPFPDQRMHVQAGKRVINLRKMTFLT